MCGRYSLNAPAEQLAASFEASVPDEWRPRLNAAPAQRLPVQVAHGALRLMTWGYTPSWAKTRLINARAETLSEKPTFRAAFQAQRCLVPADAFYEWQTLANGKRQPMRFALQDGALFAFAGIWLQTADSEPAFLIITTTPNALVAPIHDRMPVILSPEHYAVWLDSAAPIAILRDLLRAFPAQQMTCDPADAVALRQFD
jgi:putative SOS response-associated peptidase YedK